MHADVSAESPSLPSQTADVTAAADSDRSVVGGEGFEEEWDGRALDTGRHGCAWGLLCVPVAACRRAM